MGSTRALSDSAGNIADSYDYEAFGEVLNQTGDTENNYLFTGEQFDQSLNQYYLRARYYDQGIGRFTQMDTWMGHNHDPVSLHKFLYANADPGSYVDPTGNFSLASTMKAVGIAANLASLAITAYDVWELATGDEEVSAKDVGLTIIFSRLPIKLVVKLMRKTCKALKKNSFVEGTEVLTSRGYIPIEEIQIGDHVLTKNLDTMENEYKEVFHLISNTEEYQMVRVTLFSGEQIVSTSEHQFHIVGEGWKPAVDLKDGDFITSWQGVTPVLSVEEFSQSVSVYNLSVADNHNYYVGSSGLLVHNDFVFHYTDLKGYNAIRSGGTRFTFKASKPGKAGSQKGVYLTRHLPTKKNLAGKLGVTNSKIQFFFQFDDSLVPNLRTKTPISKLYSPDDFTVEASKVIHGPNPAQVCKKK